jgi:pimeloyl-ACP methyl ester carboxylesterase
MLTRNADQLTIARYMTATHERQGREATAPIARDEVLRLGSEGELVGVVSHPAAGRSRNESQPAVVILNAGVLHRVGPHRLHVALARRLAGLGFTTLRLDLGGIGDSLASSDATTFRESAVADTRLAMTGLGAAAGASRFVIFGVCSGADNAIATALADERVAGIILIDPAVYASRMSQLRALRARMAEGGLGEAVRLVGRVARRQITRRLALLGRGGASEPPREGREPPPITNFRADLGALVGRGVGIFAIYSGVHRERYNHEDQLFELFPELRGKVERAYFPLANHTFTELDEQAELIAAVTRWISNRFA